MASLFKFTHHTVTHHTVLHNTGKLYTMAVLITENFNNKINLKKKKKKKKNVVINAKTYQPLEISYSSYSFYVLVPVSTRPLP